MTHLHADTHMHADFSSDKSDHTHPNIPSRDVQTDFICDHTHIHPSPDLRDIYPTANCTFIPNILTPTWAYHSEMLQSSVRNPLSGLPNVQHTLFWPESTNHRWPTLALISQSCPVMNVSPSVSPTQISTQSLQNYNSVRKHLKHTNT